MPDDPHSELSDLWHGDTERDWDGREFWCCVEPRPEQVEQWRARADRERAERNHQQARARERWARERRQ